MNRYTLGTVLGTALLGVAKSKLGSGIRLGVKRYRQFYVGFSVPFLTSKMALEECENEDEIIEYVEQSIEDFSIQDGNDGILEVEIVEDYPELLGEGESDERLIFQIGVFYVRYGECEENFAEENRQHIVDFCKQKLLEDPFYLAEGVYWDGFPIREFGYVNEIINADTGEEYKIPEPTKTKLRKR